MPSDCCYFVGKAAAAGAAPALKYFCSILHCPAVFTQNWGQTYTRLEIRPTDNDSFLVIYRNYKIALVDAVNNKLINRHIRKL